MPGFFSFLSSLIITARQRKVVLQPPNLVRVPIRDGSEKGGPVEPFNPAIQELCRIIEEDADLYMGFHQMFEQIPNEPRYNVDPLGKDQIKDYLDMLKMLNRFLTRAPQFHDGDLGRLVPYPFTVMLLWPMCTLAGLHVFTNPAVNVQLKKILGAWGDFLSSPASRYVLNDGPNGWLSPAARKALSNLEATYECDSTKEYWGFTSWDGFFTRKFRPGIRPVSSPGDDTVIASACESVPYKISHNVKPLSSFWLKGEPYSLFHMLNHDSLSTQFIGGTVYQAYLNALNYHRWHSPVNGTVKKVVHIPGTYFALSPSVGFTDGNVDSFVSERCQAFMANLATRTLIFIQADNQNIGLMCFIAVGIVEVSSCEATVVAGRRVRKGDQLGSFHFGGSTYCLVFRAQTKIVFSDLVKQSLEDQETLVLLNTDIGYVPADP